LGEIEIENSRKLNSLGSGNRRWKISREHLETGESRNKEEVFEREFFLEPGKEGLVKRRKKREDGDIEERLRGSTS